MASNYYKIQRVLPLLVESDKNKDDYFPRAVSIGPYHHGKPELGFVESCKALFVDVFVSGGLKNKEFYYNRVVGIIGEVRDCYVSMPKFSDAKLAQMMLHDAAFIITLMEKDTGSLMDWNRALMVHELFHHLGWLTTLYLTRDLFLIDNQIPLRLVKLLMDLRYGEGYYQNLLERYITQMMFRGKRSSLQVCTGGEPLHFLEACHRLVTKAPAPTNSYPTNNYCCSGAEEQNDEEDLEIGIPPPLSRRNHGNLFHRLLKTVVCRKGKKLESEDHRDLVFVHSFRTVKDLKANGIYFKPSPSQSLKDVTFRSHFFYARLELPEWFVSIYTKVFFKNLVAFEVSPNSPTQMEVASYINLMKSLIEGPEDVKELREKRILFNMLGSDQEVLNVYKDIDTHGIDNSLVFKPVKDRIEAHYSNMVKRWMAELFHNNFRSPWTAIAFLAAFSVLAIAAAQLYYAVHRSPN